MKQLRKLSALFLVIALVIGTLFIPEQAFASEYPGLNPGLKQDSIRLKVGESKTVKLKNSKGLKAKFYADDTYFATVSKKGKVKAKREGETSILVIIDGKWRYECSVFIDPALVAKKTVKWQCPDPFFGQTQIDVERTVEYAPFEITISTKCEDENLNLMVYEATTGNRMSEVGKIDSNTKKLTFTATKTVIIENEAGYVDVTITVKSKDGKKTISRVNVRSV